MITNDHLRLASLFAVVDRPLDLTQLLAIKLHLLNTGKIGEMYERSLKDIEQRHFPKLTEWDNFIADKELTAVDDYINKLNKKGK